MGAKRAKALRVAAVRLAIFAPRRFCELAGELHQHPSAEMRLAVAWNLGMIAKHRPELVSDSARAALVRLLADRETDVRSEAAVACGRAGIESAAPLVVKLLANRPDDLDRWTEDETRQQEKRTIIKARARSAFARGQWVKILGPQAPRAAREFGLGPQMLAHRIVADDGITQGRCLLICRGDGALEQSLQQGLLDVTDFQITALYPSEQLAQTARARLQQAKLDRRIACEVGEVQALPFDAGRFDVVASVGSVPFWPDREAAIREIHRVLRPGGAALAGGMYRFMPESRKLSSEALRQDAARTGIPSIRVYDDLGQWLEIRKTSAERGPQF